MEKELRGSGERGLYCGVGRRAPNMDGVMVMVMVMVGALQKVVHGSASRVGVLLVGDGVELLELAVALVVERQDRGDVSAAVAVVGGRPDGHELLVEHVLVTLLHKLVSTGDELELVLLHKLFLFLFLHGTDSEIGVVSYWPWTITTRKKERRKGRGKKKQKNKPQQ